MIKIISGGQTGVDRGALDAALKADFPCGGWCPAGRVDENGVIPDHYPLKQLKKGGYTLRTVQNIVDSDATLIFYFGDLEGGTEVTLFRCIKLHRPYKLIDALEVGAERAADLAFEFTKKNSVKELNVAGPRESKWPEGSSYAEDVISRLIRSSIADD